MSDKPTMTIEEFSRDGNIFFIGGAVLRAYHRAGRVDEFAAVAEAMKNTGSYDEAVQVLMDAVEFTDGDDDE